MEDEEFTIEEIKSAWSPLERPSKVRRTIRFLLARIEILEQMLENNNIKFDV